MPETAASTAATADDHQLASHLAHAAGQRLLQLRRSLSGPDSDARVLRDEGDRQANELLAEGLAARLAAGEGVLSEEAEDDLVRLGAGRVWIVDPLDGTREFGEPPRSDWAVHVALTAGGVPIAGAVALPALDLVLGTDPPPPPPPLLDGPPRIAVSRTRPPAAATRVAEALGGELVPMGSAGAKAMAVVRGEADAYVHAGGQYEWDSCAPVAVALAAGLHASRLDGSPLRYNNADPYLPDLLICRPELAGAVVEAAGTVEATEPEDGTPWS